MKVDYQKDLYLLHNDPAKLLSKYKKLFLSIVRKRFNSDLYPALEPEDIVNNVILSLLDGKFETVKKNFKGKSKLSTYLSKIFINECYKEYKKIHASRITDISLTKHKEFIYKNSLWDFNLEEVYNFLDKYLYQFGEKRHKIELLLKIVYHVKFDETDIENYNKNIGKADQNLFFKKLSLENGYLLKSEIYEIAAEFFNKYEKKHSSPDALRKWLEYYKNQIINNLSSVYNYEFDEKMFALLIRAYYSKK